MVLSENSFKAVILDLDQTLTSDDASWIQLTDLLGADKNEHQKIYEDFKSGLISYESAKSQLINLWGKVSELSAESLVKAFMKIELREGASDAVEYLKSKYKVCIISGAIDVFVNLIADRFAVTDRYASTKFIFDENKKLVDFEYKLTRGDEKRLFLEDFCNKNGILKSECIAIGDGESDMPLFEEVGLPILFIAKETNSVQKNKIRTHLLAWSDIKDII